MTRALKSTFGLALLYCGFQVTTIAWAIPALMETVR